MAACTNKSHMFRSPIVAGILFKEEAEREIANSHREQQRFRSHLSMNSAAASEAL